MTKKGTGLIGAEPGQRRGLSAFIVLLNIAFLVCAIFLYGRYTAVYQERLFEENIGNISNLNQSAASNATALISSWNTKLDDIAQFISLHSMTNSEALARICDANSSPDRQFQLIGSDYSGYLARRDTNGAFIPVSYQKNSYEDLKKVFDDTADQAYDDICFAPEFTDSVTALKYFAIYKHLPLMDENGEQQIYTLLLATKSSDVLAVFNMQNDFQGQSTVLMDAAGNYIVSSADFKSTNFFQYLYVYNDLSLDQRRAIEQELSSKGSGELYYKNAAGQDCVFRYERMATNNWYCITCVPIASFQTPVFSINYAVYAVLSLLLMLVTDMLWLRGMNRRLRASMLREKEASAAKTDFLSRMSHDIRTPLNGIIGLTHLAMDESNPPRTDEYLEHIKVSGQFLSGLVNDILDLSKVESGKVDLHPEPYSSAELCTYVESVVLPLCRDKKLEFRMSPPTEDPPVLLDRLRFNQVIFNLLSNSVKYTPEGGLVELYWERTPLPNGRAALDFTVRDNGIGMSEAFQEHMFESFSQEQEQTAATGSGLGLAIVHSLVGLMNGEIRMSSKQGQGTTFIIHLEAEECPEITPAPSKVDTAVLKGKRILLCEDNDINVLVVKRLLEKWGMAVDVAINGKLGLEAFRDSAPGTYDAILMDVMMPEMNGLDATRAIRRLERPDAKKVPILSMTANAYDIDVKNCLDAGMNAHMGKPIIPEQLQRLLTAYLQNDDPTPQDGEK